jgi:hypothetical protein
MAKRAKNPAPHAVRKTRKAGAASRVTARKTSARTHDARKRGTLKASARKVPARKGGARTTGAKAPSETAPRERAIIDARIAAAIALALRDEASMDARAHALLEPTSAWTLAARARRVQTPWTR